MWTFKEDCAKIIAETCRIKIYGCPMYILDRKLHILKNKLKEWNKNIFGNVKLKVIEAENCPKKLQKEIDFNGFNEVLQVGEIKAHHDLERALILEEEFWKEKASINWHSCGDGNTKLFHTYAKIRRKTNFISSLNIDDVVVIDISFIENYLVHYFQSLFIRILCCKKLGSFKK